MVFPSNYLVIILLLQGDVRAAARRGKKKEWEEKGPLSSHTHTACPIYIYTIQKQIWQLHNGPLACFVRLFLSSLYTFFFLISLASAYIFIRVVKLGGEREEEEEERTVVVIVVEFGPDWNAFLVKMHSFGELRAASRLIGGVIYQRTSREDIYNHQISFSLYNSLSPQSFFFLHRERGQRAISLLT